ncbi:MAG: PRC-barrel domain-containing protein [Nitrososphaerales archaeon]|jgi:sporulation protein YlmC with PRC-barrel domain
MSNDSTPAAGYLKREQLVGKSVVSSNAEIVGTVRDIAVGIDGKVGLHVMRKSASGSESETIINADEIQAMGDVVLLKPVNAASAKMPPRVQPPPFPTTAPQAKACARCGYMNGASSKFCIKCGMSLQ